MRNMKVNIIRVGVVIVLLVSCFGLVNVSAQVKSEKALYEKYIEKLQEKGYIVSDAVTRDINKDGVKEMLVTYLPSEESYRTNGLICTIKNGKVSMLKKFVGGVSFYYKSGKTIVVGIDNGGYDLQFSVYKLSGGKLTRVTTYKSTTDSKNQVVYKKDSKKISEKTFLNYMNSLEYII